MDFEAEQILRDCPYTACKGKSLEADNKRLREEIEGALRISDLWTLKDVETMFEEEAKALELMKTGFEQALKE